jgi:hypothetical protein
VSVGFEQSITHGPGISFSAMSRRKSAVMSECLTVIATDLQSRASGVALRETLALRSPPPKTAALASVKLLPSGGGSSRH